MFAILFFLFRVELINGLNLGSVFNCSGAFSMTLSNGSAISFPNGMNYMLGSSVATCEKWNGVKDYNNKWNSDYSRQRYMDIIGAKVRDDRLASSTRVANCYRYHYHPGSGGRAGGSSHESVCTPSSSYMRDCMCKTSGSAGTPSNLVQLAFTNLATASLDKFGTVKAWGIINGFAVYNSNGHVNNDVYLVASACLGSLVKTPTSRVWVSGTMRWGLEFYYKCNPIELHDVKLIAGAKYAFAALFQNGTVFTWGEGAGSKDVSTSGSGTKTGIHLAYGSGGNRCIYCYNSNPRGRDNLGCSCVDVDDAYGAGALTNVVKLYSGDNEFLALRQDGSVVGWGQGGGANVCQYYYSSSSGFSYCQKIMDSQLKSGVVSLETNRGGAWVALKEDGSVVCFGRIDAGGSCLQTEASGPTGIIGTLNSMRDIVRIVGGQYDFVAVRSNGGLVTWGKEAQLCVAFYREYQNHNPACSTLDDTQRGGFYGMGPLDDILSSGVISVTSTAYSNGGFWAALKDTGQVVVWGTMGRSRGHNNMFDTLGKYWAIKTNSQLANLLSGTGKRDGSNNYVTEIQGNRVHRADGEYPLVNNFDMQGNPYPTGQPSGQPTSQPTGEPTTQPSEQPTTQPSEQPTTQPSSQPSGSPTSFPTEIAKVHIHTMEAQFNLTMLSEGKGMHFTASHTFVNLGQFRDYYLTLYMYDTGFGPSSSGQYVVFGINGDTVTRNDIGDDANAAPALPIHCSALDNGRLGCNHTENSGWVACAYNIPIKSRILRHLGGSIRVTAMSSGVSDSSCPYVNPEKASDTSVVYLKFTVSPNIVETPSPTAAPTLVPTKTSANYYNNGVVVNVNSLNVWNLVQINVAIGVIFAAIGIIFAKLREKSIVTHEMPLFHAALSMGFSAMEFCSLVVMLTNVMGERLFIFYGGIIVVFRLLHGAVAFYVLDKVYSGDEEKKAKTTFANLVDNYHLMELAKAYSVIVILSFLDCSTLIFLPWYKSSFASLSKGYPTMEVFRPVQQCVIFTSLVTMALQIPFLAAKVFSVERDLFNVINIIMMCLKVIFTIVTFISQNGGLQNAEVANAETMKKKAKNGREGETHSSFGDIYPSSGTEDKRNMGQHGIENWSGAGSSMTTNPMFLNRLSQSAESMAVARGSTTSSLTPSMCESRTNHDFPNEDSENVITMNANPMLAAGKSPTSFAGEMTSMALAAELVTLRQEQKEMKSEMKSEMEKMRESMRESMASLVTGVSTTRVESGSHEEKDKGKADASEV